MEDAKRRLFDIVDNANESIRAQLNQALTEYIDCIESEQCGHANETNVVDELIVNVASVKRVCEECISEFERGLDNRLKSVITTHRNTTMRRIEQIWESHLAQLKNENKRSKSEIASLEDRIYRHEMNARIILSLADKFERVLETKP
jgi:predicted ribosome quality control (RQC) complex YloA/Tae2 family protein